MSEKLTALFNALKAIVLDAQALALLLPTLALLYAIDGPKTLTLLEWMLFAAVTSASTAGNAGGDTTFGALFTWPGGPGGTTSTAVRGASAAPGNLSGAYLGAIGDDNQKPVFGGGGSHTTSADNPGKSSIYGGAGGGAGSVNAAARNGGASMYGGAGGAGGDSTDGADGAAPAGAGGGTRTGATSGAGARGQLEIWGVC